MRKHPTYSWAVVLIVMLIGSFFAGLGQFSQTAGSDETVSAAIGCRGGSTPRTVLIEKFTADWCQYCTSQSWAIGRLANELGHENLVVLEYHSHSGDEMYINDAGIRAGFYGVSGYPTVVFDGGGPYAAGDLWIIGGWTSRYIGYPTDRSLYEQEKVPSANSNMTIEINGNITGTTGYVHARVTATDPITETNLRVRFVVYQNGIYHRDGNTHEGYGFHHRVYNHIVRDVLPDGIIPVGFDMGDSVDFYKTFSISSWYPSTDKRRLGIAVFVQTNNKNAWLSHYNAPVLQAASHDFVDNTVLLVNGDSTDVQDEGFERFEDVMTKMGVPFTVWDTFEPFEGVDNLRTMPTLSNLANYGAVLWFTGEATTTFSVNDRTAIGSYLAGGGSVFVTGEDIGMDASSNGWTAWYLSNLHATFLTDTVIQTAADGVPLDPITNGLIGLGVFDSSPSRIAPGLGANEILLYTSTTYVAGLRAAHDTDSGVVYIAFDYFEGTDTYPSDVNAETLMDNAIYWLDGQAPPKVQVVKPATGDLVIRETEYTIEWSATDVEVAEDGVDVEYTTDSGMSWNPIISDDVNDEAHYWNVPAVSSSDCKVRVCVRDSNGQQTCAETGLFRIGTPNFPPEAPLLTGAYLSGGSSQDVSLVWDKSADDGEGYNDVVEYDIYESTTLGGPQTYIGSEPATGSATYTWSCNGCGDGDPNQHFFYVWADDGEETTVSPAVAGKFVRPLSSGWTLVSIPLIQMDASARVVLQTIDTARAAYYDAFDGVDHWKSYDAFHYTNDLENIDRTMGFWLYSQGPDDFVVAGIVPESTEVALKKGWNMIGFPSFTTMYSIQDMMSVTPVTEAEAFEPTAAPYYLKAISPAGVDPMNPGEGYWVYATSAGTWFVL